MFGFIRKFDAAKGVGSIETTTITEDHLPLIVESGFSFEIGQRVAFSIARCAQNMNATEPTFCRKL
jgi:cold shock CspA family protein